MKVAGLWFVGKVMVGEQRGAGQGRLVKDDQFGSWYNCLHRTYQERAMGDRGGPISHFCIFGGLKGWSNGEGLS